MTTPTTPDLLNITDDTVIRVTRRTFAACYDTAREARPLVAASTSPADELPDAGTAAFFITVDGRSGYYVRADGYAGGLFSTVKGRGDHLVRSLIEDGGTHGDCFDGYLVTLYARHGLHEDGRAPNWTPGEPDFVWFSLRPAQ